MYLKNLFFHFYFLNTNILVTAHPGYLKHVFKTFLTSELCLKILIKGLVCFL